MPKYTRLEFRSKFTEEEKVAIELASLDNPNGTSEQRQLAAMLRVYLADLAVADFVDTEYAATSVGVQRLEQYGLIGPGRAVEILNPPATEWPAVGGFVLGQKVKVLAPFNATLPDTYEVEGFGPESVVIANGRWFAPMYLEAV